MGENNILKVVYVVGENPIEYGTGCAHDTNWQSEANQKSVILKNLLSKL